MQKELSSRLNFPDPLKPTGIEFDLPGDAYVTLKIFDQEGKEVLTLVENGFYKAGTHNVVFSPWQIRKGMYFYRLSVQQNGITLVDTKNIVV